jgi:hypothetical protein
VRVEDPVGGGVGLGNAETFVLGAFPDRGLTAANVVVTSRFFQTMTL